MNNIEHGLIKEYLGGRVPCEMSLSEREKLINKILLKDTE